VICSGCHRDNPQDAAFCAGCGAPLVLVCPSCARANAADSRFCNACGCQLAEPASEPGRAESPAYPPKHLAKNPLTSISALEAERKQVTVLFADVKESTALIANRDPEEAQKILDPVVERMIEAVHHYEGTVSRVMGDGIMALFGAPRAEEDHAVRACNAALRMRESVRSYAEEARRSHAVELQIRIGLHSGEVVVRTAGNDLYMDYTAVGETTHLAARMEQLAVPGTIRMTGETFRLVEGYVEARALGPIVVKGFSHPVEVYEAVGYGPARTRFQATAAARTLARFVGRDVEFELLRRALEQGSEGRGQIVAVVGEAGVGKSRLLYEFTRSPAAHGWTLLESGALPYGKATSYLPVIGLLKVYFRIGDRDDYAAIRQKVTAKLVTLDCAAESTQTPLLALLDLPVEGGWRDLDPPRRRQQTLEALKRLFLRESQTQPLLLLFEDLHWMDAETQAFLDGLVDSLPTGRLLVLLSYRPEYKHGWGGKTYYTQVRLDPLPPRIAEELLRALLGDDASIEPLKPLLTERAYGNPLFLEECARSLIETGALAGERGAYRLVHSFASIEIPPTLQAILASRIDRLAPDEKQLLHLASVIGKNVPLNLLRAVAGRSDEALRSGLARLQAAELLYELSLFPDPQLTFKHALTHDVAYGSLLRDRRRSLHARVVEAIGGLFPDRLAEHFERLAHHAFNGELWEKAVYYSHRAARKAGARSAYREAAVSYEQALAALAHLPEDRDNLERALKLRFEVNFALLPIGELSRAITLLDEAAPLAEALGDRPQLARVLAQTGDGLWAAGSYDRAIESERRALDIARALGDSSCEINVARVRGMIHYTLGDFERAIEIFGDGLRALDEQAFSVRFHTFYAVYLRVGLGMAQGRLGRLAEGLENARGALRIAESAGDLHDLSLAHNALGFVHFQKGEFENAARVLERGFEICEHAALAVTLKGIGIDLGRTYIYSGRIDEGLRLIQQTLQRAEEVQHLAGDWQTYLAEAHLRAGHLDQARSIAEGALDLSRARGQRGAEARSLHLLGDIASSSELPDLEAAAAHIREAITRAEALGMRPLLARCHLSRGEIARRTGQLELARQHLDIAARLFREMGIQFWLEKAEAQARALA
jgi:class 3 adenylate cyclase/tetratricopeptide (TPR) repeat protein